MAESFIDRVRSGGISHPTQPRFTTAAWRTAFASSASPTVQDRSLLEAGEWTAAYFDRVRSQLQLYSLAPLGRDRNRRALVGAANLLCSGVGTASLQGGRKGSSTDQSDHLEIHSLDQDLVQATADGLRFPLADAHSAARVLGSTIGDAEVVDRVRANLLLGNIFDVLHHCWLAFLWHDFVVTPAAGFDVVEPRNLNARAAYAVGVFRRDALQVDLVRAAAMMWTGHGGHPKPAPYRVPTLIDQTPAEAIPKLAVGSRVVDSSTFSSADIRRLFGETPHEQSLRDEPLQVFGGLSVAQLLEIWSLLESLADIAQARMPRLEEAVTIEELISLSPIFSLAELQKSISSALSLSHRQSERALRAFIAPKTHRADLWLRPLIPLEHDKVTFVLPTLQSPNLLRLVEQWFDEGGIDISRRGSLFEAHVRGTLGGAVRLSDVAVHPSSLQLSSNSDAGKEEIDLLIRLGETVLVGEVKCSCQPDSPLEHSDYWRVLEKACAQAVRKARFVEQNPKSLQERTGWNSVKRVLPLAVTNLSLGAGFSFHEVAVVDQLILNRFFVEGFVDQLGTFSMTGQTTGSRVHFYGNEKEAEANVAEYLRNPPQLAILKQALGVTRRPILQMDSSDRPAMLLDAAVTLPVAFGQRDHPRAAT